MAAMVAAKLLPAVQLDAQPRETLSRWLVYSTQQVINPQMPIERRMETYNQQVYGNIPTDERLATGAIIGYIDVWNDTYIDMSMWNTGDVNSYEIHSAALFDRPIVMPEQLLRHISVDKIADTFPSNELSNVHSPHVYEDRLILNVNAGIFYNIGITGHLSLALVGELKDFVLNEDDSLLEINELVLTCGNRRKTLSIEARITFEVDENGEPKLFPSILDPSGMDLCRMLELRTVQQQNG